MLEKSYSFGDFSLTLSEVRTVSLLMTDLLHKDIADILKIKPTTLENRLQLIFNKTRMHKARMLVLWAIDNGFDRKGNLNGVFLFDDYINLPADFKK